MPPPRSVADATRFTATGPHAFTRSTPTPGTPNAPPVETPQQRVARLRSAAQRAKIENVSTFDRIVDRGRVWADRAHRVVAFGLIGATVLCAGITAFAFTDMILFARRKKAAYAEEQRLLHAAEKESLIASAVSAGAEADGIRAHLDAVERERASRPRVTIATRLKEWAVSGLTSPEKEGMGAAGEKEAGERVVGERVVGERVEVGAQRDDILRREGADDLVKGPKAKGGSTGVLSSITGWWN